LVACGGGGGSGDDSTGQPGVIEPPDTDLEIGEVRIHTNLADPRLFTSLSPDGELVEVFGVRNAEGSIERAEEVHVLFPNGARASYGFDEQERLVRIDLEGEGGMRLDWAAPEIGHVRFFDAQGSVVAETWIDAATGLEVDPPAPSQGLVASHEPGGVPELELGAPDPEPSTAATISVRAKFRDCDGQLSYQAAATAESVRLLFQADDQALELPMERQGGEFVASIPRFEDELDWQQEQCEAMLAWSEDVCNNLNEPTASSALLAACEALAVAGVPIVPWLCIAGNVGVGVYCAEARRSAELACAGGVILWNPWDSFWDEDVHRQVQAKARVLTCSWNEWRHSEIRTVTSDDLSVSLEIDGCIPEVLGSWSMWSIVEHVGVVMGSSHIGYSFLDQTRPELGFQDLGSTPPMMAQVTETEECFWVDMDDPIYRVVIEETAWAKVLVEEMGGEFECSLDVQRVQETIRPPTQAEIDAGIPAGVDSCMQQTETVKASLAAFHQVYVKPFQKLVVRLQLQDSNSSPDDQTTASVHLLWPSNPDGTYWTAGLDSDGTTELVISHDELRRAHDELAQLDISDLPPDLPLPPTLDLSQGLQCYATFLWVSFTTDLKVGETVQGSSFPKGKYDLEIVAE